MFLIQLIKLIKFYKKFTTGIFTKIQISTENHYYLQQKKGRKERKTLFEKRQFHGQ